MGTLSGDPVVTADAAGNVAVTVVNGELECSIS